MTTTTHASFVIERHYSASPPRVYAAWADPEAKRAWFVEGEGWDIQSFDIDFREGGSEKSVYGFRRGEEVFGEKTAFSNETVFNEIIENERIVFTYSMARNGRRFSVSLATVEIKTRRQRLAPHLHRARRLLRRGRQRHHARTRLAGIARQARYLPSQEQLAPTEITP